MPRPSEAIIVGDPILTGKREYVVANVLRDIWNRTSTRAWANITWRRHAGYILVGVSDRNANHGTTGARGQASEQETHTSRLHNQFS